MKQMTEIEINDALKKNPHWKRDASLIHRTWNFTNFLEAIAFVNQVAALAEQANHHPDILVQYSKVKISLWTHDCGGISDRDFSLAAQLDTLV